MISRVMYLYWLTWKGGIQRIRFDLVRELVVGFCTIIMAGLFYYIFDDFLNSSLIELSSSLRETAGSFLGIAVISLCSIACGLSIRRERLDDCAIGNSALSLGESPQAVRYFWLLRIPTLIVNYMAPAWMVTFYSFVTWDYSAIFFTLSLGLFPIWVIGLGSSGKIAQIKWPGNPFQNSLLTMPPNFIFDVMVSWRVSYMLKRNRISQICLLVGVLVCLSLMILPKIVEPMAVFIALLSGLMWAFAFCYQISLDLEYSWIEKNLGVSHNSYMTMLLKIALLLGLGIGLLAVVCFLLGQRRSSMIIALKISTIAACPSLLVPSLIFQVDARRFFIQLINVILSSIFVSTAVYAHLAAALLLPLTTYYGVTWQQGRFYRS